tara:strand:+ start:1423 stop:1620 length:198 start_codon:yes stop_codon:yes gene_type:complete
MKIPKTNEYRIIGDGLLWYLQVKKKLWFFAWWSTVYVNALREEVFRRGLYLQDQQLKNQKDISQN